MRWCLVFLLISIVAGCSSPEPVNSLLSRDPDRVFITPESPSAASSALASFADEEPGKIEQFDSESGLVVVSAKNFMSGLVAWTLVAKADQVDGATRVRMWTSGVGYRFGPTAGWADRLWSRYVDFLNRKGLTGYGAWPLPVAGAQK